MTSPYTITIHFFGVFLHSLLKMDKNVYKNPRACYINLGDIIQKLQNWSEMYAKIRIFT